MLAGVVDLYAGRGAGRDGPGPRGARGGTWLRDDTFRGGFGKSRFVFTQRFAGMRSRVLHYVLRCAGADDFAAGFAAFGAKVYDPVACCDHVEIVLDHDERVAGGDQLAERAQQFGDVVEVQAGGGLVEQEQTSPHPSPLPQGGEGVSCVADTFFYSLAPLGGERVRVGGAFCGFGQMSRELQALGFAARQRRHRLAESQVFEADVGERTQSGLHCRLVGEKSERFADRHLKHVGDGFVFERDFEYLGAEALAVAIGAAQVNVGEELHLDMLEAVAAAHRAAAVAGVEAESAARVIAFFRQGCLREQVAYGFESTDVAGGVGASSAPDRCLVDHHDVADQLVAVDSTMRTRRFGRFAFVFEQRCVQHVLHQRRFARAGNTGHAHQAMQRQSDVDVLEVVFACAKYFERRTSRIDDRRFPPLSPLGLVRTFAAGKVSAGQ